MLATAYCSHYVNHAAAPVACDLALKVHSEQTRSHVSLYVQAVYVITSLHYILNGRGKVSSVRNVRTYVRNGGRGQLSSE